MQGRLDLLLFAEDPSAANYAALLLPEFRKRNWSVVLCAANVASGILKGREVEFVETDEFTDAGALLDLHDPRCVLAGTAENPGTLGLKLISAAQERGICSIAFADARMNSEYRFRGHTDDPLAHAPDWLLVPDDWTRETFAGLGFARERIVVSGHPQYDAVRLIAAEWSRLGVPSFRSRIFPEVPAGRPVLVFVSEGALRYDLLPKASAANYGLKGRGLENGRTKIALEEVLNAVANTGRRPYVVFRAHPIEDVGDYAEYSKEIDRFSCDGSALELVFACDLVVGMTSMLLLEAALLGKACLAVLPDAAEGAWLPGTESGLISYATSREGVNSELNRMLKAVQSSGARLGEIVLEARAVERTADFLAAHVPSHS